MNLEPGFQSGLGTRRRRQIEGTLSVSDLTQSPSVVGAQKKKMILTQAPF